MKSNKPQICLETLVVKTDANIYGGPIAISVGFVTIEGSYLVYSLSDVIFFFDMAISSSLLRLVLH